MNEIQSQYLEDYLNALPASAREKYSSFSAGHFCADKRNADICSNLVLAGIKTATCSMKYWYENDLALAPEVGHLQVFLNWEGVPTPIIETLSVSDVVFCDVPQSFAVAEGEGDRSLQWWRMHTGTIFPECAERWGLSQVTVCC
jgi:uncharacterized protein YhfF